MCIWTTCIYLDIISIFSRICSQNYRSVTSIDFQGFRENRGSEPLPFNCHQVGSGFVRQKPITTPLESDVGSYQNINHNVSLLRTEMFNNLANRKIN